MLLEGRSRNINARRRSRSALIFVSVRQHVLISDSLMVRNSYFDFNIMQNENARILRCFFSTDYFEADVDRNTCLHATSSMREVRVEHFDVSNVIYHKFSHGGVSYTPTGENVNVILECSVNIPS